MELNQLKALVGNWEFWLSVSLLFGVLINLSGAWNFFKNPQKSAQDLGIAWSKLEPAAIPPTLTLMRLAGVCLIALAVFYFVTALGPVQQAWSVVAAVIARLSGVIFYAWNLVKFGGPPKFKFYLGVNSLLAASHGILLAICPGGLGSLSSGTDNFFWFKFFQSL